MVGKHYPSHDVDLTLLPIFSDVPEKLLQLVKLEEMVRFYADSETILHQGDEAKDLVILLHGQACILTDGIFLVSREPYEVLVSRPLLIRPDVVLPP
jgi:hypothetical protein